MKDPSIIFEDVGAIAFEKETLMFCGAVPGAGGAGALRAAYEDLQQLLQPYNEHYVFTEEGLECQLVTTPGPPTGVGDCIFGEMAFGSGLDDQWLVISILCRLSQRHGELFIHVWDNEGETLLVEAGEVLPGWLEPANGANRPWIHQGKVVLIPDTYYQDRGLSVQEALLFLGRASSRCDDCITSAVLRKVRQYPQRALERQVDLPLTLPRRLASLLVSSRVALHRAVGDVASGIGAGVVQLPPPHPDDDLVDFTVTTTAFTVLFLRFYMSQRSLADDPAHRGSVVAQFLDYYVSENGIDARVDLKSDHELKQSAHQRSLLQAALMAAGVITEPVQPNLHYEEYPEDLEKKMEETFQGDEVVSRLQDFFREVDLEETDSSSGEDEDQQAREYFRSEGVDIDEDDFFEFFAKEALKLSDEQLEELRSDLQPQQGAPATNGEADKPQQGAPAFHEELGESLAELLKSIKEGGGTGPAANFLRGL